MTNDIGSRLKEAIPQDGIRAFHREMERREVRGASYAMIHRYLSGEAVPPVEFLEVAADVLGVRPAWLICGDGPMRDEPGELLEELSLDAAARLLPLAEDRQVVMHTFFGAMRRLLWAVEVDPEPEQVRRLAELLVGLVREPYRRIGGVMGFDVRTVQDHYVAMLHAIMLLVPPWSRVDSIETIISKLEGGRDG